MWRPRKSCCAWVKLGGVGTLGRGSSLRSYVGLPPVQQLLDLLLFPTHPVKGHLQLLPGKHIQFSHSRNYLLQTSQVSSVYFCHLDSLEAWAAHLMMALSNILGQGCWLSWCLCNDPYSSHFPCSHNSTVGNYSAQLVGRSEFHWSHSA